MTQEIDAILESEEKIVRQDVINRKVMGLNLAISLIIFIAIASAFFSRGPVNFTINGAPKTISGATIGIILVIIGIIISLWGFFASYVKIYSITNKRVLIKSGIIGTDFNSIYFTEIKSANVNVGLIDKIFGIGTINIDTGKLETINSGNGATQTSKVQTAYDKLLHVSNPYEVYKHLQSTLTERQEGLYSGRADRENISKTLTPPVK